MLKSRITKSKKGAGLVEYVMLLSLIGGVAIAATLEFGEEVGSAFSSINESVSVAATVSTTSLTASPIASTAPTGPASNNEYYEVLDGFDSDFIQFDDANPLDDTDVVDMESFVGPFGQFVSINFYDAKEFSIFDSSTGNSLHFVDVEELRLPISPLAFIDVDKDGWGSETNFTTIINE